MVCATVAAAIEAEKMNENDIKLVLFRRLLIIFFILDEVIDNLLMEFLIPRRDWRRRFGLFFSIFSNTLMTFMILFMIKGAFSE